MGARQFTIVGLDHIVLRVRDLPGALEFYCGTLGCTVEREQRALGLTQLRAGRSLIDLVTADGPLGARTAGGACGPNLEHFCLSIAPFEERSLRAHLEARGVRVGETQSRYGAEGEGPSLYLEDPEGNRIELKAARHAEAT
ncbi:MAG TPA: VOC family protein [Steroidobacteraceae bacterium]|nr:VOC family protein [Steroidobacteraceae bacterium]